MADTPTPTPPAGRPKGADLVKTLTTALADPVKAGTSRLELAEIARKFVNLGQSAIATAIEKQGMDAASQEAAQLAMEAIRVALGYDSAPVVEQLVIDQVAICQLRMHCIESRYAQVQTESVTLAQGIYWERKLSAVQGRYLRAVETLARIRKLLKPTLQVNIATKGGKQIIANAPGAVYSTKPAATAPATMPGGAIQATGGDGAPVPRT